MYKTKITYIYIDNGYIDMYLYIYAYVLCVFFMGVCVKLQGYSPNNLNGDDFDDPLGLDISYFQTNPWNSIITYIYIYT